MPSSRVEFSFGPEGSRGHSEFEGEIEVDGASSPARYRARTPSPAFAASARFPLSAERSKPPRLPRLGVAEASRGHLRARVFLASTCGVQVFDPAQDARGILAAEIPAEQGARPAELCRAESPWMAGFGRLGLCVAQQDNRTLHREDSSLAERFPRQDELQRNRTPFLGLKAPDASRGTRTPGVSCRFWPRRLGRVKLPTDFVGPAPGIVGIGPTCRLQGSAALLRRPSREAFLLHGLRDSRGQARTRAVSGESANQRYLFWFHGQSSRFQHVGSASPAKERFNTRVYPNFG